ncbi:MAG: formyltetrahydrofolate deformylase [Pseudomonadota bacterium]
MTGTQILTATCPARAGIVAAVTGYLADQRCYISALEQFDDESTRRFFMRAVFRPQDEGADIGSTLARLEAVMEPLEMTWQVHRLDVPMPVVIMVSKFDHCLADLLYRVRNGELPMRIAAVVSNHRDCRAVVEREGLLYVHLPVSPDTKPNAEARLLEIVSETGAELVVLARYMQILSAHLADTLRGRCINIHHSFLPGFKGARPYHQAYKRGVKLIGATAHYVTSDLDEGPIIEQQVVRVRHHDLPDDMVRLGRDIECQVLSRAVKLHVEHRVFVDGNKTVVFESS